MNNKLLNEWKIINRSNDGDFSVVYKVVRDDGLVCAIKEMSLPRTKDDMDALIKAGIVSSYEEAATFFAQAVKNELDIMKKFKNIPNIINFYDFKQEISKDQTSVKYYIRMEYLEDVKTYSKDIGISQKEVAKLGIDICSALELFYSNNITHNDIKPGNIFVDKHGNYKLGDFGIATRLGGNNFIPFGTLNYISPEVYCRKGTLVNSDLYSLGLVMYKLLAGELPFVNASVDERKAIMLRMSGNQIPPIEGIDKGLMDIVIKACNIDPRRRFSNVTEMKKALMSLANLSDKKQKIKFQSSATESTISIYDNELLVKQKNKISIKSLEKKYKDSFTKEELIKKIVLTIFFVALLIGGVQYYRLNRTCGEGKINKYGKCVSGYYYCDDGYYLNGKKCQKVIESKKAKITYSCKSGYTLKDEMCINNDVRKPKPVLKCAVDGYVLNAATNKCEMTISGDASAQLNCNENDCLVDSNKTYTCPDSSYKLSGTKCTIDSISSIAATPEYICSAGGSLVGDTCHYAIEPSGAAGGVWWGDYKQVCSKGEYSYSDGKCHYSEPATIYYKCSQGKYDGKGNCIITGVSSIDATVKYSCNSGYTLVPDTNMCAKTSNVTKYVCPDNAVLRGTKCYMTTTMDAINFFECDQGFVLAGTTCVKNEEVKAVKKYRCSKVYTLNGEKCEKYSEKPAKAHYNEEKKD